MKKERVALTDSLSLRSGQQWLQLGPLRVAAWVFDKPVETLDCLVVSDAKGVKDNLHNEELTARDLCGVMVSDLPKSMCLTVNEPRIGFSGIHSISVRTEPAGRCDLKVLLMLYYDQFHLPCNPHAFTKRLAAAIHASSGSVRFENVREEKVEAYAIAIEAHVDLDQSADIGEAALLASAQILDCYKRLVNELLEEAKGRATAFETSGAVRWWTKEFIVPMTTSGVVGAVLAWVASRIT